MDLCSVVNTLLITSSISPRIDWDSNNSAILCAFSGNDLTNSLTKSTDCGPLCLSTPDCTHYTWTDFNSGTCWMKRNKVSKTDAIFKHDQNAVCGIVDNSDIRIQWDNKNSALRCAFSGNDLTNALTKREDCHLLCAFTPDCTHYTWTDFNSGTCWMKRNVVSKSEAIVKLDQNAICGVISSGTIPNLESKFIAQDLSKSTTDFESSFWIFDPAINSTIEKDVSQSGRSTRYWDCCKPSCSWNGKASVTSPVNSCNRDGFNVIDKNTRNGCENGGNAFTCNNNIPWAINDNLAYGFAAANIKGQSEADWCCQCYELTFTSGPVNGKKMIVQVTNTGGDLGENHFDLQMPGGGVGIFNGCSSQWGAPDGGWGDRYGGVHSLQECDQLPSQIRQGCKWRFEWFKGADNPSFNFNAVACPNELTSKTGCSRR